ncbi:MAG: FAD-binding oxidoreductase [candidate division NC10 bacterium]|nr:FAD-binding oxidoreductase [candidate division NC10 bacterium]
MAETADIVIIGAGIVGCSIAYHLALQGSAKVVVVEKDLICSGSTGKSAGGIRQQFATEVNLRLSIESLRMFHRMREELRIDPEFRQVGYLFMATAARELEMFRRQAAIQQQYGIPVQMVSTDEIRRIVPYVRVDDIIGGVYCPTDGYAAPYEVTMGYAAAARRLGVTIHEQRAVTRVVRSGDGVAGVETSQGPIHGRVVVNAAGAEGGLVGALAGVEVPVSPYRRQVFVTNPLPEFNQEPPLTIDYHRNWYFRGEMGGCLFSGPKDEESTFNTNVDWEHVAESVAKAVARVPSLEKAEIKRGWAGSYDISPDNNAILGALPELPGFYVATGHSGHGFMHGPATGKLMAELILTGKTSIDISSLGPERFRTGRTVQEPMTMHAA